MDEVFRQLSSIVTSALVSLTILVSLFISGIIIYKFITGILFQKKLKRLLEEPNLIFLSIKVSSKNDKKEDAFAEVLNALYRILPNNTPLNLEIASVDQFLHFYISIPKIYKNMLESQLYAQYAEIDIEEVKDYLPDLSENAAFVELTFKKSSIYPLSDYKSLKEDMLKSISSLLSRSTQGERVFFQLVLKRVGSKFWQRGFSYFYFKLFGKKQIGENQSPSFAKLSQNIYRGKIRIAYVAEDKNTAKIKLYTLIKLYDNLKSSSNQLKRLKPLFPHNLEKEFKTRLFEGGNLFSISELATLYHFPYQGSIISNVVQLTSKFAPPPDILPIEGMNDPKDVSFFGETNYRNERKKFGIKRIDRRRHLYIVGKTGSGKSKLLELLLVSDIQNGQGCCLLDPHGDLSEEILKFVPQKRIKDVVYINPVDQDFPIGFNPLEPVEDYQMRQHISTFFISIFKKLLSFNWNPRMEHVMRYITLALLETPDSNLLGIQRILSDATFRQRVIKQIQDPVVKNFWLNEFKASDQQFINEAVLPILNKIGQFTSNQVVRNMIGQRKNMLQFEKFMNTGKIVIISISKGKLGDENSALLGSMFITKIQQAALARASMPEEERRDFYFYVDEFQNFATDAFSSILSEARKYHLDLTIAHQYMAQLPMEVKATAFGNVGTIISFAVGGDDAAYLSKEFSPTFTSDDLISLDIRNMYIKMSVDGKLTTPFSARTITVPRPQNDYTHQIIDHSRMTYGKNKVSVENEIANWTKSVNPIAISPKDEEDFPEPVI